MLFTQLWNSYGIETVISSLAYAITKKISFFKSILSEVPSVQISFLYDNAISHWSQVVNEQLKGTDAARLN